MAIPARQALRVASYIIKHKIKGTKHYPLVLMLESTFRCNLACAGCGKVQYPPHILKRQLTVKECLDAMNECDAPIVCIPGGEPFLHPNIVEIVEGLVKQKRFVYLCTNALELERRFHEFKPSTYFSFAVHLDGLREHHDMSVCREGSYDIAVAGIKKATAAGFRVITNTTLFDGANPKDMRQFFDDVMSMGVEGMTISPGYSYDKAPDQNHFLGRGRVRKLFRSMLSNRKSSWKFNMSPLFLEFLMGERHYECTPWGMPCFSIFGWQKPCYLIQEGYADSYKELTESVDWSGYGSGSGNPKCANCMVSCGYEWTSVVDGFSSLKGFWGMVRGTFSNYPDAHALEMLDEPMPHGPATLVQIETPVHELEGDPCMTSEVQKYTLAQVESLELKPGTEHENLEGWVPELASPEDLCQALEKAFDYRGDVTITTKSGEKIEAFIFNRHTAATLADSWVMYFTPKAPEKRKLSYAEIARLEFSGKDRAVGKHWEDWVKAYNEKKAAGEKNIALHPDSLE